MKFLLKSTLFATAVSLTAMFSCSQDDEISPVTPAPDGQLIGTFNEHAFASDVAQATIQNGQISIMAQDAEGNALVFSLFGEGTGVYEFQTSTPSGDAQVNAAAYTLANASISNATFSSISKITPLIGTVTISELDEENQLISGNFHMELSRFQENSTEQDTVIVVENGSFTKIPYTEELATAPENTFSGKLDGNAFEASIVSGTASYGKLMLNFSKGASGESIALTVPDDITTGEYDLAGMGMTYAGIYTKDQHTVYEAESGTLTISKHDVTNKRIEGSFQFTATAFPGSDAPGNPVISDCVFSLSY